MPLTERLDVTGNGDARVVVGDGEEVADALAWIYNVQTTSDPVSLLDVASRHVIDAVVLAGACATPWMVEKLPDDIPVLAVGADLAEVSTVSDPAAAVGALRSVMVRERTDRDRGRLRKLRSAVTNARDALRAADSQDDIESALIGVAESGPYNVGWLARRVEGTLTVRPVAARGIDVEYLGPVPADEPPVGRALDGAVSTTVKNRRATVAVPAGGNPRQILFLVDDRLSDISETERKLLSSLARTADRATGQGLDTATDRVTILGDTLAHELSNQLDMAGMHLELPRERGNEAHFEHVETALERIENTRDEARLLARADPDCELVDVAAIAEREWDAIALSAPNLKTTCATVEADPALLRLAVENLLRNATDHGGDEVTVRIGPLENAQGFFIADDGPGISEERRDTVLGWGEGDDSGVGLGIVALIAERHDWYIDIKESKAGGARFEFKTSLVGG